jgi:hypothetical protein
MIVAMAVITSVDNPDGPIVAIEEGVVRVDEVGLGVVGIDRSVLYQLNWNKGALSVPSITVISTTDEAKVTRSVAGTAM